MSAIVTTHNHYTTITTQQLPSVFEMNAHLVNQRGVTTNISPSQKTQDHTRNKKGSNVRWEMCNELHTVITYTIRYWQRPTLFKLCRRSIDVEQAFQVPQSQHHTTSYNITQSYIQSKIVGNHTIITHSLSKHTRRQQHDLGTNQTHQFVDLTTHNSPIVDGLTQLGGWIACDGMLWLATHTN